MSDEQEQPTPVRAPDYEFAALMATELNKSLAPQLALMVSQLEMLVAELAGFYPVGTLHQAAQALAMWRIAVAPLLEWIAATLPRRDEMT